MPKLRVEPDACFLNIPYDKRFENLYLAYIVGLTAFGLVPVPRCMSSAGRRLRSAGHPPAMPPVSTHSSAFLSELERLRMWCWLTGSCRDRLRASSQSCSCARRSGKRAVQPRLRRRWTTSDGTGSKLFVLKQKPPASWRLSHLQSTPVRAQRRSCRIAHQRSC
jgi:hypothetical protein